MADYNISTDSRGNVTSVSRSGGVDMRDDEPMQWWLVFAVLIQVTVSFTYMFVNIFVDFDKTMDSNTHAGRLGFDLACLYVGGDRLWCFRKDVLDPLKEYYRQGQRNFAKRDPKSRRYGDVGPTADQDRDKTEKAEATIANRPQGVGYKQHLYALQRANKDFQSLCSKDGHLDLIISRALRRRPIYRVGCTIWYGVGIYATWLFWHYVRQ